MLTASDLTHFLEGDSRGGTLFLNRNPTPSTMYSYTSNPSYNPTSNDASSRGSDSEDIYTGGDTRLHCASPGDLRERRNPTDLSRDSILDNILDSFRANLTEITDFTLQHMEVECNHLNHNIHEVSSYVEECTLLTNNRTNNFISNLLSNINAIRCQTDKEDVQDLEIPLLDTSNIKKDEAEEMENYGSNDITSE